MFRSALTALVLGSSIGVVLTPHTASAQASPDEKTRKEARDRFDRGLRLFNQQDNSGPLAEFQRAYELIPHPLVLYNIGLVNASMRNPVASVAALDKLLADPGKLDAGRLQNAKQQRDEQAALIAEIAVVASVDGASIEVDNVEVAKTPLSGPLKVSSGEHVVSVIAPGYLPARRRVTVAGKRKTDVSFELQPMEGRLAHVAVKASVPDAQVVVDGVPVGQTPLPASLAFAPGKHSLEVRRAGYTTVRQSLDLGEGTAGEVSVEMVADAGAMATEGGTLTLRISEPDAVVFVDSKPRGAYSGGIRMPHGKHRIRVERADFFPFERDVEVKRGGRTDVQVDLEPTPEYRADYHSTAKRRRTWGWITLGIGGALAAGSGGFLAWNAGDKKDKEDLYDEAFERYSRGNVCDPLNDTTVREENGCTEGTVEVDIRLQSLEEARDRDLIGFIGVGVGAAALGTGIVLLVTADDPDRYEPKPESDVFARARVVPMGWFANGGGGAALVGEF